MFSRAANSQNARVTAATPVRPAAAGGFTIVELMVTVTMAAILVSIAIPAMRTFLQNDRQWTQSSSLVMSLNAARNEAIKQDTPVMVCPTANGTSCDPSGNWPEGWIVVSTAPNSIPVMSVGALAAGTTLSEATAQPAIFFSFHRNGSDRRRIHDVRHPRLPLCAVHAGIETRQRRFLPGRDTSRSGAHMSMMRIGRLPDRAGARGFTLVEVLVSLLVLSIGLLGISKLVLFSARANDSAYQRSQATALAYSLLDSMRANRTTVLTGGAYAGAASAAANPGTTCALASPCTSGTQLAQYDMWQWKTSIQAALGPSGDGTVTTANVTDPASGITSVTATITVKWDDTVAQQSFGAAAGNMSVTLETVL